MPPRSRAAGSEVQGMRWEEFLAWFRIAWRPSQHLALIGKTGCGKSTFACGVLDSRKYLLALDPKGGDETLGTLRLPRLTKWPPSERTLDAIAEGRPARFIVGPIVRQVSDRPKLRTVLKDTLTGVFEAGGFTVYVDEFQLFADRRMMNLAAEVETLLIAARSKGISVVTSYQAPAWVPTAASRQATWVVVWPTRDMDVVKKLAAIVGRDWRMLWEAMQALPDFHVLIVGPNPRDPMIITTAPRRN